MALALDPAIGWAAARRALTAEVPLGAVDADAALETLGRLGGRLVVLGDEELPAELARLKGGPVGVFLRGELPTGPYLGIVGSRACSRDGARLAWELAGAATRAGLVVVSGGALGIDAAAHEGALAAGGTTVAVLGSGLDRLYPERNVGLFERIAGAAGSRGAVMTPFPPGVPPLRSNFPRRNLLVAALAERVVVVEARGRSGALLTARAALAAGRPVGAVPGTPGCDRLLAAGARRLHEAADLGAWVEGVEALPTTITAPTPEAQAALEACNATPRSVREIASRAGLTLESGRVALGMLELWGLVVSAPRGRYVRTIHSDHGHELEPRGEDGA